MQNDLQRADDSDELDDIVDVTENAAYSHTTRERIFIMTPILLGGFIALLNETLLNVAFPSLMASLHVSMETIQWLATCYMLIIGILIPVTAFLLKTFSTKFLYLVAMGLFMIGSLACGLSPSFPVLLVSRMVQGAGTGMLLPIMMNTIMGIFPPASRGSAMGICAMVVVVAPGVGPVFSGILLHHCSWNWLFFSVIPVALVAIVLGCKFLGTYTELTKPKLDILSVILSTIGFGGMIFGICAIENLGFFNPSVLISLLCGIVGLFFFSWRQFKLEEPLLKIQILRVPMFTLGIMIIFISFMLPFAVNIILPTYIQNVLELSTITAGLALLPGAILNMVFAPVSGKLFDRFGVKPPFFAGFILLIISMSFLTRLATDTPLWLVIAMQSCMIVGTCFTIIPAQTSTLNHLSPEDGPHGIALMNTIQQIAAAYGSALFIGLLGAVQVKRLRDIVQPDILQRKEAIVAGCNVAFIAALVMVILGLIMAILYRSDRKR